MSIKAIIVDFGDVLVRTSDYQTHRVWEKKLGIQEGLIIQTIYGSEVAKLAKLGKALPLQVWQHIADMFHLDKQQVTELKQSLEGTDFLDMQLTSFLQGLRPQYRTAILSNAWLDARATFSKYGLDRVFDEIIISAEEGLVKPDPRLYQLALRRLNTKASETIFIDDLERNIEISKRFGMKSILFKNTEHTIEEITKYLILST